VSRDATTLGGHDRRPDADGKARGQTRFVADLPPPGTLYAALVTSTVASARLDTVTLDEARRLPGVRAVLTAADIPGTNSVGVIFADQPLLVTDRIRMVGDRLALIAADTPEIAAEAAARVVVSTTPLDAVHDPETALDHGAAHVHEDGNLIHTFTVRRGPGPDPTPAAAVVEAVYHVGGQEHAYLEPQGVLVAPEPTGGMTVHVSCQCPFYVQHAVARVLGCPLAKVRVQQTPTGGAFGGKEDYPSEPAACAALLAHYTRRPVQLVLPREHDMQLSTKRHAVVVHHRWGADAEGRLLFAEVGAIFDAGAYAGLSTVVAERANVSCVGPYDVPSVRVDTKVVYTNNLFAGAFRGFGAPQVTWAAEATMDRLANQLRIDPLELRRRNLIDDDRPVTITGQRLDAPVLARDCLDAAARLAGWNGARSAPGARGHWREGIGAAIAMYGCNLHHGGQRLDRSSAIVILQPDGSLIVRVGLTEMGQGNLVAVRAVAANALRVPVESVEVWMPDTTTVADSGPTVASRGVHASGLAVLDAISDLRRRLDAVAAELLGCSLDRVELTFAGYSSPQRDQYLPMAEAAAALYARRVNPVGCGWWRSRPRTYDPATGTGEPYAAYAMACHIARVAVDEDLGLVRVLEVAAAHDVGTVLHRDAVEGQVHGGIVQGMGWGVTEELRLDGGRLLNASFTDYVVPTASDTPEIQIELLEGAPAEGAGPYGAKGIGEPSLIPTAAAIRNAVCQALGVEIDRLPLTPPTIVEALGARHRFAAVLADDSDHGPLPD
jgi:CO/xanthine dehydrogenase Mo-binding subunit